MDVGVGVWVSVGVGVGVWVLVAVGVNVAVVVDVGVKVAVDVKVGVGVKVDVTVGVAVAKKAPGLQADRKNIRLNTIGLNCFIISSLVVSGCFENAI